MKALSFRQPWAELVVQGRKWMDLRTYATAYRGPLAIHASRTVEREACRAQGLDPDAVETGGVVGVVELVDVVPLSEAEYEAQQEAHLGGRSYREGMYGWVLRDPQRLPQLVPARGRMNLFTIEWEGVPQAEAGQAEPAPHTRARPARGQAAVYRADPLAGDPERPFTLQVLPLAGSSTSYALSLEQRVLEPAADSDPDEPRMTAVATLGGDNLRAVASHAIEALREAGYRATDLSPERREPFYLPEAVGVRLGLVLLAVRPLSKGRRVEAISHGVRQMPLEEAYYWYSKCTDTRTADRAQRALRVLLAEE